MINTDIKTLLKQYTTGANKRYLYRDVNFDERGIDYKRFLKLRLTTFDNDHNHIEKFTTEGFRILWYLMTRAKQNTYITTTVKILMDVLNITRYNAVNAVNSLITSGIIQVYSIKENQLNKVTDTNKTIHIIIKYSNDLYNLDDKEGYKAIPFDFAYRIVTELNDKEFTLLMFLIIRHRYYMVNEAVDSGTGEIYNYVNKYMYAFPTQDNICDKLKIRKDYLKKYLEKLSKDRYIDIVQNTEKKSKKSEKTGKQIILNANHMYIVNLLNRMEYIKYHIVDIANEEIKSLHKDIQKYINKTNAEDILIDNIYNLGETIRNKIYLESVFGNDIEEYYSNYNIVNEEQHF